MGNGSHARIIGVGMVNLKLILGKYMQLKNVECCTDIANQLSKQSHSCPKT